MPTDASISATAANIAEQQRAEALRGERLVEHRSIVLMSSTGCSGSIARTAATAGCASDSGGTAVRRMAHASEALPMHPTRAARGLVDRRRHVFGQLCLLHVADDADDLHASCPRQQRQRHAAADRIVVAPEQLRRRPADQHARRRRCRRSRGRAPSGSHRRACSRA